MNRLSQTITGLVALASLITVGHAADGVHGTKSGEVGLTYVMFTDVPDGVDVLQWGVGGEYRMPMQSQLDLVMGLSYSKQKAEVEFMGGTMEFEFDQITLGAQSEYALSKMGNMLPFAIAGADFYYTSGEDDSETDFGIQVGVGGEMDLGAMTLVPQIVYTNVLTADDASDVNLGAKLYFPMGAGAKVTATAIYAMDAEALSLGLGYQMGL